ncbi:MAG: multidrug DMT transporter permease [Gallionellales bacterium GWA2_60_142]|nr:MAG: multidrug DMT transporter permease [Gallionellales bacterium GWA2_60_142]
MPSKQNVMPVAGLLSGALVWGMIWYPFRELEIAGVDGALATLLTYLLALASGLFLLPRVWRELFRVGWWGTLLVLSAGWTNFGYVLAILDGEVMRVLLLFYLAPVWTILFSYWLLGERLNRYGYAIIFLSFSGAMVMLWEPQLGMPLPNNSAEWIGLSAGMGFALSNVVARRCAHLSVETKSFGIWIGTALLSLLYLLYQGGLADRVAAVDGDSWLLLVLLGIVLCAVSFAVQYGIARVPANRAIVLFLSELVVAAIVSYFLAGEAMQLREWVGAALIVSASLMSGRLYAAEKD